jgi:hypothetical protein
MFLTTLQLFRYIQSNAMLPHLVRFNSCPLSASEIIPLRLHTVKGVFANFAKLQKISFLNFLAPSAGDLSLIARMLRSPHGPVPALRGRVEALFAVTLVLLIITTRNVNNNLKECSKIWYC